MTRKYDYTPERHVKLMHEQQDGKCAVKNCGTVLFLTKPRNFIIEHLHQLSMKGSNALKNKRLYCIRHAKLKTNGSKATSYGSDTHARAKCDRILGLTCTQPTKPIPPRPFDKRKKPMTRRYTDNTKRINGDLDG